MTKPARYLSQSKVKAGKRRWAAKQRAFDLGLAISAATLQPGQWRSAKQIAAFCDVSHQAIEQIEASAIAKVRVALRKRYAITSQNF
jgi:hypothetical protein